MTQSSGVDSNAKRTTITRSELLAYGGFRTKTFAAASEIPKENKMALIIEDVREASAILADYDYACTRITYGELMSCSGEEHLQKLLSGLYKMLWISTPSDWYVKPREKRAQPVYARLANWMTRAVKLGMQLMLFGPPGAVWKQQVIRDTIEQLELNSTKMRLCHFGERYDRASDVPSGS